MGKKIVFTGGGSAGHVSVNLALIPLFLKEGWEVSYIGSKGGIERQLTETIEGVRYYSISTGKLRRYFDWNNFKDPFRVMQGAFEAFRLIKTIKPDVVFSKGGFVSVPVILGSRMNKVPIVTHESDLSPGLANRLSLPFANKVCTTFPETTDHLPREKAVYAGAVIRKELHEGIAVKGRAFCGLTPGKPIILIMGGSLGSKKINEAVRLSLDALLPRFQIIHLCGKGQKDSSILKKGYIQFEYVSDELADILAATDFVISRAGSNSIFEFLSLRKPMLLIPLSKEASRGDQIENARSFEKQGYCEVLFEEDLTAESLMQGIEQLYSNQEAYISRMEESQLSNALDHLFSIIKEEAKR
ncbi:undecaprenyldiphospho-muramoylpentapeptide beta-N-acetylglucosaminyltransferase [Fictibacillus sp. FJAT-27399]|uniref:undecaprenyldiphospho-muramoylpentapeptide beta-N-acetylglucosaminyltransferase n=1 Tax=Fictibacillus sp. FJAT-27399 TaxID=1729689 RepID=UPI000782EAFD|nr:undecaprenyldiphospho-muramoylpentapeptide beta-N-acetylglucosaminyltransferase [Fictibacillus sp. FJAT-27399]